MIASKSAQSNLPHVSGALHNLEHADDMSEITFVDFFFLSPASKVSSLQATETKNDQEKSLNRKFKLRRNYKNVTNKSNLLLFTNRWFPSTAKYHDTTVHTIDIITTR